jgi:hypothetical protein
MAFPVRATILYPGGEAKLPFLDLLSLGLAYWVFATRPVIGTNL